MRRLKLEQWFYDPHAGTVVQQGNKHLNCFETTDTTVEGTRNTSLTRLASFWPDQGKPGCLPENTKKQVLPSRVHTLAVEL